MNKATRRQIVEAEGQHLSRSYPGLTLELHPTGGGVVTGQIEVAEGVSFTTDMRIPSSYPDTEPILICDPKEIPWKLHRHVYANNTGRACLCGRCETRIHWPWGSNLTDFVTKLVYPYFAGQFYYDTHGEWPPTGERDHGKPGILETFTDLVPELKNPSESQVKSFLRLLARKSTPKGHELCPCGSRKKLRGCHEQFVSRLRSCVDPRHAALDLKEAFGTRSK